MVDKIDKPDWVSAYGLKGPAETKKDKPKEERGQEDLPTFQQKEHSVYEEKFQLGLRPLQTVSVPFDRIQKMIFRRAVPFHGNPTAEAQLVWRDGRTTEVVSFLLRNWQDFLRLKNLKAGEIIPPEFWQFRAPDIEVTIWQKSTTSGSWNIQEPPHAAPAPSAKKNISLINRWRWIALGAGILIVISLIIWAAQS